MPEERAKDDVNRLHDFFRNYKFFIDLQANHTLETLHKVLQYIQIQRIEQDTYLFDEGDDADRFYIVLKGDVNVEKATETPVPKYADKSTQKEKIMAYL